MTIENDTSKRGNFEEAADFLCRFAPKKPSGPGGLHRISSTYTDMRGELDKLQDVEVDIRFYKPDEWRNLSNEQRRKCILTRHLQNGKQGGSGSGGGGNDNGKRKFSNNKQTKRWKKKIERQGRLISALKAEKTEKKESVNASCHNTDNTSNRLVTFNQGVTQRKKE